MTRTAVLNVEMPESVSEDEARLLLALKLFELSRVSLGQAATIAGYSKRAFMDVLGKYHIPVMNYTVEELREEIDA